MLSFRIQTEGLVFTSDDSFEQLLSCAALVKQRVSDSQINALVYEAIMRGYYRYLLTSFRKHCSRKKSEKGAYIITTVVRLLGFESKNEKQMQTMVKDMKENVFLLCDSWRVCLHFSIP